MMRRILSDMCVKKVARILWALTKSMPKFSLSRFFFFGIDWPRPLPEIDRQLYDKYSLFFPARHFIESMIKLIG